jgi:hypothetical protein
MSAAQALSRASLYAFNFQQNGPLSGTPSTGLYDGVRDQAVFLFKNSRNYVQLAIPAPIETIFAADTVTVDLSDPLVADFISQALALLGDSTGANWTRCAAGRRRRVRIGE